MENAAPAVEHLSVRPLGVHSQQGGPDRHTSGQGLNNGVCVAAVCQAVEKQQWRWGRRTFLTAAPCGLAN